MAAQRAFEHQLFAQAGFSPIAQARAGGSEIRRLLLFDPYMMLPMPGIELQRWADGHVTLRLQYPEWSSDPVAIDASRWRALTADDAALFAPPEYRPAPVAPPGAPTPNPPPPPPICHGWSAILEADEARTAGWSACGNSVSATSVYALAVIELAMGTRSSCAYERQNPFWSFQRCFGLTQTLDDPALEARFAVLRREYDEAPGADRLAEARHALSARNLTRGSQAWIDARAAVDRVREVNAFREERLRRLLELAAGAPHASPGDRFKMRQAISSWSNFQRAQDANLGELVESLARIGN